jgi:hypothetical protein
VQGHFFGFSDGGSYRAEAQHICSGRDEPGSLCGEEKHEAITENTLNP